jgi:hypothetical protein
MWTTLLTLGHIFIVSHKGLSVEIGFGNLDDAEAFFTVEVQRRTWDREANKPTDTGHRDICLVSH